MEYFDRPRHQLNILGLGAEVVFSVRIDSEGVRHRVNERGSRLLDLNYMRVQMLRRWLANLRFDLALHYQILWDECFTPSFEREIPHCMTVMAE
jgi:hypothetical protein